MTECELTRRRKNGGGSTVRRASHDIPWRGNSRASIHRVKTWRAPLLLLRGAASVSPSLGFLATVFVVHGAAWWWVFGRLEVGSRRAGRGSCARLSWVAQRV